MTKATTSSTARRGAKKTETPYTFNVSGKSFTVNLCDEAIKAGIHAWLHQQKQVGAKKTWTALAAEVKHDKVHGVLLGNLTNRTLTTDVYVAIRDTFGGTDAMLLLNQEQRDTADLVSPGTAQVTELFPMASVQTPIGDEPVDWKKLFAELWETGCIDTDVVREHSCVELRGGNPVPYRDLVLAAIIELVGDDVTASKIWQDPPLVRFARRITGEDMLVLQDILIQRAVANKAQAS